MHAASSPFLLPRFARLQELHRRVRALVAQNADALTLDWLWNGDNALAVLSHQLGTVSAQLELTGATAYVPENCGCPASVQFFSS
jgi:hypothetical protein